MAQSSIVTNIQPLKMRKVESLEQFKSKKASIAILLFLHLAGAVGYISPLSAWFVYLTPILIFITGGMIWIDSKSNNKLGWPVAITIILLGYFVEIIGVNFGFPFGEYRYGDMLGWKFFGTPPIIGLQWMILVWGSYSIFKSLKIHRVIIWFLAASLITFLYMLIEPVSIYFDLWEWSGGVVPLQNYIARFVVAFLLTIIFHAYPLVRKPRLGQAAIICQFLFYGILYLSIKLN